MRLHLSFILISILMLGCLRANAQDSAYADSLRAVLESRNAVGTKAADFSIMTTDGNDSSLYGIESDYTLVYLYHPDCYTCVATIQYLQVNEKFRKMIGSGEMTALAVDLTEDMVSITQNMRPPKGWTLCFNYDAEIVNSQLYYILDFPSVYLLDKDKTVLLKNPEAAQLLDYLVNLHDVI